MWKLYEMLKGNMAIDIKYVEQLNLVEVKEAVLEYLEGKKSNERTQI